MQYLKKFTENDLQQYLSAMWETVDADIRNGDVANRREGFLKRALEVMHEELLTSATDDTLMFAEWVVPVRGRTEPLEIYAFASDEKSNSVDVFVPLVSGTPTLIRRTADAMNNLLGMTARVLKQLVEGKREVDTEHEVTIGVLCNDLKCGNFDQINIFVITDQLVPGFKYKTLELSEDISVTPQIFDIQRMYAASVRSLRQEIIVDFTEDNVTLPAVVIQEPAYDCYLTAIPGNVLKKIHDTYGRRVLDANVRSFQSFRGKVNKEIRDTIIERPEDFIALNNGLVITADEVSYEKGAGNAVAITGLRGMQIVNGGQTTFTVSVAKSSDLLKVWVPAKIIDLSKQDLVPHDEEAEETEGAEEKEGSILMMQRISHSANHQNAIRLSDLASNSAWNRKLEALADKVTTKSGTRWFFERTKGSFATLKYSKSNSMKKAINQSYPFHFDKADVARYINSWRGEAWTVALGKEKNHVKFAAEYVTPERLKQLDADEYRRIIAKGILYRTINRKVRTMGVTSFIEATTNYLVALIGTTYGDVFDLDYVWMNQATSEHLNLQLEKWILELVARMNSMVSAGDNFNEFAKKKTFWEAVKAEGLSKPASGIPELS